jgi:hypothetical protein
MSSSQQQPQRMQPPYIGSKISLISKLDIRYDYDLIREHHYIIIIIITSDGSLENENNFFRYEGTLYTVDPIESTIALAKGIELPKFSRNFQPNFTQ